MDSILRAVAAHCSSSLIVTLLVLLWMTSNGFKSRPVVMLHHFVFLNKHGGNLKFAVC